MSTILDTIVQAKVGEVRAAKAVRPESDMAAAARAAGSTRGFTDVLRKQGPIRAIAEFKRASPSAGVIRSDLEVEDVAAQYESAGASVMSILTDMQFFQGDLEFLARARSACQLPLLRKDFIIDPYQVLEARAAGADAVLLIVAALSIEQLRELYDTSVELGLGTLIEIHSEAEAEIAVTLGAPVIGVNHRDLKTFTIDMSLTKRLRNSVPESTILVGESGIRGVDDVRFLHESGADAILVGEHLMRAPRPGDALAALLG